MNKLGDLVSQLRVSIKATSDDSLYSDEYLYNTLRYIRNRLIATEKEQLVLLIGRQFVSPYQKQNTMTVIA